VGSLPKDGNRVPPLTPPSRRPTAQDICGGKRLVAPLPPVGEGEDCLAFVLDVRGAPLGVALARLVFTSSPWLFARYFLPGLDLVRG
jgi:hypothetical protein